MECLNNWRSPKTIFGFLILISLTAIILVAILQNKISQANTWTVSATGQGKIAYQPDIANLILGVKVEKIEKAENALSQLNEKMNKTLEAIKKTGVNEKDLQVQSFSLYPQYDTIDNITKVSGYSAEQQIFIKVKNLKDDSKKVGQVISEAINAGANEASSITFTVSNLEEIKQQARIKAIQDARQKAQELAQVAGVKLKKVTGWWENIVQSPGISSSMFEGKGGMSAGYSSTSIPNGEQEIIIEENVSYEIK